MKHAFVFIEVFGCEGGIQSYIQDVLAAYSQLAEQPNDAANIFLLRDALLRDTCLEDTKETKYEQPLQQQSFHYHYFKSKHPTVERIRLTTAFAAHLIRQRPDHVFCGHINLAAMVSQLCRVLNIPYTVLTYGKEVWYELPSKDKHALMSAHRIWTISRYSRDLAHSANEIPKSKFEMLPCVVDGDVFSPGQPPAHLVERYQLQNAKVLTTVARLWSGDIYKGVDVTIRALPKILTVFPAVKYVVIGRGDDQPRLAKLAKDLGVAEQIIFAGFVADDELIDHYRLADVYVMPSKEGFGIVYLEAMACGVPVVAGDDDGSADPLQDGKVGWQVPHRDPDAVAAACIEALSSKDQRTDSEWLRAQTLAHFSAKALVTRLSELVDRH